MQGPLQRTVIRNARLFESDRARFVPGTTAVIEGERIAEATQEPRAMPAGAQVIDAGLQETQQRGLCQGPRLFVAGFPISQTGGHADMRPRSVRGRGFFCSCAGIGLVGAIAYDVGEVRRAVREQVRTGANQIKIMAGGGIASPSYPLEGTQF